MPGRHLGERACTGNQQANHKRLTLIPRNDRSRRGAVGRMTRGLCGGGECAVVTMKDVAIRAGVTKQTVSNVVNKRPVVAPETVARVEKAIAELGFRSNLLARGLATGQ